MSDSESDIEPPTITSTQIIPESLTNAKHKSNFKNKLGSKTASTLAINNLLKQKALVAGNKPKGILKQSKNESMPKPPKLPKLNAFDDEVDSLSSGNISKKLQNQEEDTSGNESEETSGSDSENGSNSPTQKNASVAQKNSTDEESSNDEDSDSEESEKEIVNKVKKIKNNVKQQNGISPKVKIISNTVVKGAHLKDTKTVEEDSENSSDESSSSSSDEDINTNNVQKNVQKDAAQESSSSEPDTSSDEESSSGSESEDSSDSDSSNSSPSSKETKKKGAPQTSSYAAKAGTVSSSESDSSEFESKGTTCMETKVQPTKKTQKVLSDFVAMHNLEEASLGSSNFNLQKGITSDDEVFTLKISKQIDPTLLKGSKISLVRQHTLKINDEGYLIDFDKDDKDNLCLLGIDNKDFIIKQVKTKGSLTINRDFRVSKRDGIDLSGKKSPKKKIPFPTDKIKLRHPLFGNNYEKRIVLDKAISKKLDSIIDRVSKTFTDDDDDDDKLPQKVHKKKKKVSETVKSEKEISKVTSNNDLHEISNKQRKKRKKDKMDIDSILSSFAELPTSNEIGKSEKKSKKKKRDNSSLVKTTPESPEIINFTAPQAPMNEKKSKKRKISESQVSSNKSPEKAINKQLSKIVNSTMCSPSLGKIDFDPDESVILSNKKVNLKVIDKSPIKELSTGTGKSNNESPPKKKSKKSKIKIEPNTHKVLNNVLVKTDKKERKRDGSITSNDENKKSTKKRKKEVQNKETSLIDENIVKSIVDDSLSKTALKKKGFKRRHSVVDGLQSSEQGQP